MRILTAAFVALVVALVAATQLSAQGADRAAAVIDSARKAIGGKKLDELRSLSVEAVVQRNAASMQVTSDVEILLELPDKYVRSDQPNSPGMIVGGGMNTGFNGDRPLQPAQGGMGPGGMMFRVGPGGPLPAEGPKPTPEEQARMDRQVVRTARQELSRLMLGWFAAAHPGVNATYLFAGEAESPDGKAHVIDARNDDGFEARLFIDQRSNLPLMVTYKGPQRQMMTVRSPGGPATASGGASAPRRVNEDARPQSEEERQKTQDDPHRPIEQMRTPPPQLADYTLFFDDWRAVDGVRFPHRIRRAMGTETIEEWTIDRVRINPKIDPKKFAVKD
jgi:hypothetical protein